MKSTALKMLALAPFAWACGNSHAGLPFGTLEWVQPSGTVSSTEVIDVRMRFTLDPNSPVLDFSSNPLTGFAAADLPTQGQYYNPTTQLFETHDAVAITGAYLNTYFGCDDTFTGGCNGNTTNYSYDFFTTSQPGNPAINFVTSFALAPGASIEYLFARFTPAAGGAAPGTYNFYRTGLTLTFQGVDAEGHPLGFEVQDLGVTCSGGNTDACAFTRTVLAVPEPATGALWALGLAALAIGARRRKG
jgi:hypothetical protein